MRKGFTLAEILITLGIIGVVAAMTIPTLIANINGQRYRSQLKKTVSTLNQAVRMAQAQYDFNFADLDNPFAEGMDECAKQNPEQVKTICSLFNGTLTGATYLGTINDNEDLKKAYEGKQSVNGGGTINSDRHKFWALADGTLFILDADTINYSKHLDIGKTIIAANDMFMMGFIDVNGMSLPNKEIQCSEGDLLYFDEGGQENPCIVKTKDITDIYPVYLYDSTVIPASNAGAHVFNTAK
ncbi:type II secretion system protein [bacterium]|nr:type II secretion system protein [bacterium]